MKKSYIVLSLAAVFLVSACNGPLPEKTPEAMSNTSETTNMVNADETAKVDDVPADRYAAYTETTYNSLLGKKPFAVFFHAAWCPTCIAMEKDILANLSELPSGTVLLKADYDTEKELKAKYKITSQSTIVMINAKGEATETLAAPSFAKIKTAFTKITQ